MIERIAPERYLLGIAEMPYSWGEAALQSQVIAARTYLASLVSNPRYGPMATYGFDICDWSLCQVYKGTKYGWLEPWEDAVVATEGRILMHQGSAASTFYHSTSGLTTRSIQDVWPSAAALPYLQAVEVPKQNSRYETWWYKLPLDAFIDILAQDGITFDGQIESIRPIVTLPGEGPYLVRIRTTEETRTFPISTMQQALNRHAIPEYRDHMPPLLGYELKQAALSPTFTVRLRSDGFVGINGQGWGHQIGLSQYGANAMAELGRTADDILSHFYTGLTPEDDPGLIPDLVDVGLFYENGDQAIVLRPEAGYTLRSAGGVVTTGTGATITITRHGDDAIAVSIEE
jgi:stage II sporulation protein D